MELLKPCPFCGHIALMSELKQAAKPSPRFFVVCSNLRGGCIASLCQTFGGRYFTTQEAAERWNRRVEDGTAKVD